MWEEIEMKLNKINVKNFGYDHRLCSEILDDSLVPIIDISDKSREIFTAPGKKFLISANEMIMNSCKQFIDKEKVEKHIKEVNNFGDAKFGEFLDRPKKLQDMTNKILDVLRRI